MTPCRPYRLTLADGSSICLGATSRKEAEHFLLAIRPQAKIVLVEEIKPSFPLDNEPA